MARTLAGYLTDETSVYHARDIGLHSKSDVEWIEYLHSTKEQWIVFTGDSRIQKNKAERAAFRRAGLRGVVLNPAYQKTPMGRCCGIVVAKWDDLVGFIRPIEPPFLIEMSINLNPRFRVLPL